MKTILVCDDHSDIRQLIRITLGGRFEVLEAEDGVTALGIVKQRKPAAVVLDIMMPGELDGLAVLQEIKRDPELRGIVVIMVTARGQSKDYEAGLARGADAYFVKPFSPLQLVSKLTELLA